MLILRSYQSEIVSAVRQKIVNGVKKILLVLSTGSGKTAVMFEMSRLAVKKGGKVLLLVHRRDLAFQTANKFKEYGLESGIIMSGVELDFSKPIQIASVWTYNRRLDLSPHDFNIFFVDASLILIDEAHRSLSNVFQKVMDNYDNKVVVGVTATPCLSSGKPMGKMYDSLVDTIPISRLIDECHLVPCVYYGGTTANLKDLKTVKGDWDIKELGRRSDKPELIGDVIDNWLRIAPDRQTIVFGVNRKHSKHLRDSFLRHGIATAYLDAFSPDEEREDVLTRYANREIQVIVNVALFQEFLDAPITSCIVIARCTKSMGLYRQLCGRGLRPHPESGKTSCTIIDHGGCVQRLGYIDDDIEWTLEGKGKAYEVKKPREKEAKIFECEMCRFLFTGPRCPQCGTMIKDYGKKIATTDDELKLLKGKKVPPTAEEKRSFYAMLLWHCGEKKYSQGWAFHKYSEKYKEKPNFKGVVPMEPDDIFKRYITYLNIRFAKSKYNKRG